jgi:ABC-type Zn uptake system ZnuABC Zn-binding protein ZnuA
MASLVDQIRSLGVPAIFLESGANPALAEQIAQETGIRVITGLNSHSLTVANGNSPTYIAMLQYNVQLIVAALR